MSTPPPSGPVRQNLTVQIPHTNAPTKRQIITPEKGAIEHVFENTVIAQHSSRNESFPISINLQTKTQSWGEEALKAAKSKQKSPPFEDEQEPSSFVPSYSSHSSFYNEPTAGSVSEEETIEFRGCLANSYYKENRVSSRMLAEAESAAKKTQTAVNRYWTFPEQEPVQEQILGHKYPETWEEETQFQFDEELETLSFPENQEKVEPEQGSHTYPATRAEET